MKKVEGKQTLNVRVPVKLYMTLKRVSLNTGLSQTEIITQYLRYLDKKHYAQREPINEHSDQDFELYTGNDE